MIDDELPVRKAIARSLGRSGLNVVTCASAQEYLEQFDPDLPGCLLLDLAMPGINGLELQQQLTAKDGVTPPIIFLTGRAEIPDSVKAMKRGAVEFLTKPADRATLIDAVQNALERDRNERQVHSERNQNHQRLERLTPREREVLSYVIGGYLNKHIAAALGTVEQTIKVHRARAMEKLQVKSFAELVLLAKQLGIIPKPGP